MAGGGRVVAAVGMVLMLMVMICHFSSAQHSPNKRKKVARPPKRRVAHIVKDLEKNVTALWDKVDMLSQPVHVHVYGDSHLMDHHDYHDRHGGGYSVHHDHDYDHDRPCDPEDRSSEEEEEDEKSAVDGKLHVHPPPRIISDGRGKRSGRYKHARHGDDDDENEESHKHGHHKHRKHSDDGDEDDNDDEGHKHGHRGKHGGDDDDDNHEHKKHGHDRHHPGGPKHHHRGQGCRHMREHHHPHHHHSHHHHSHGDHEEGKEDMQHQGAHGTHVHIHLHAGGMEEAKPPHQDVPPAPAKEYRYACCELYPGRPAPNANGTVMFRQMPGGPLEVKVDLSGFPIDPSKEESVRYLRGMHGHDYGAVREQCMQQGGHYNPHGVNHGGPRADIRHPGDFGNVELKEDGTLNTSFNDTRASLFGDFSLLGHGLLFHEGADDLGLLDTEASKRSGNAGARAACCAVLACKPPPGVWPVPR